MAKNLYAVLGVTYSASPEEIKDAYRRLVREYHPDHYGPDSGPFLDVQEAYGVLGDPRRRRDYDQNLDRKRQTRRPSVGPAETTARRAPVEPLDHPSTATDLGDVSLTRSFRTVSPSFDELFDRLWRNFSGLGVTKAERPRALVAEIVLSPDEARHGGHARIRVPAYARCPTCGGRGAVGPYECWRCAGEGGIAGELPVTLSFPPGMRSEHDVLVPLERFGIRNLHLTVRFRVSAGRH
jgi:DnaJ-class molecular chaperone